MRQSTRALIATVVTGIVVAACGGGAASQPPADSQPGASVSQPSGTEVSVGAAEFAFDPGAIEVPTGGEVTITLSNKGTVEHDFTIDALAFMVHANPGETASGTATFAAGTYEFYCSVPGHKQAGMVGRLTAN